MMLCRVVQNSGQEGFLSAPLSFKVLEYIHCSKDLNERHTILLIYNNVRHTKFNAHLVAIHKAPECPLFPHHLNNVSKSLTTTNLIQAMSSQDHEPFFFVKNNVLPETSNFLKLPKFGHCTLMHAGMCWP